MESIHAGTCDSHVSALGRCAHSHGLLSQLFFRTALVSLMAHMCWQGCLDACKRLLGVEHTTLHKMSWLLWTLISSSHMFLLAGRALAIVHLSWLMHLRGMMGSLSQKVTALPSQCTYVLNMAHTHSTHTVVHL